jgi:hypothetical protein
MSEIKKAVSNLAEVVKKYLQELCEKENLTLVKCEMKDSKIYFKIKHEKITTNFGNSVHVIENELQVQDVNITRIKKRIRQLIGKEPMDIRECVHSSINPGTNKVIVCDYFTKSHIFEGKKVLNFCGKYNETCTQIKYKGKA